MSPTRFLLALALAASLQVAPTAVAAGGPAAARGTVADGGAAQRVVRPKVGECHLLSAQQVRGASDPSAAVSCRRRHTTRVIAVFDLPPGVGYSDPEAAQRAQDKCYPALRTKTGARSYGRLALSAFSFAYFYPTASERRRGSRFVRCDMVVQNGTGVAPLPLPDDPLLARGFPNRYRRCNNDAARFFPCTRAHRNRATASFALPDGPYPGGQEQRETASQRCLELVGRSFEYYYFPDRAAWSAGYRAFTCLRKAR